jgi:hypothetical protein
MSKYSIIDKIYQAGEAKPRGQLRGIINGQCFVLTVRMIQPCHFSAAEGGRAPG